MYDFLVSFDIAHPASVAAGLLLAQWVFSAAVDSLPQPKPMGSPFYQFAFTLGHKLAGNIKRDTQPTQTTQREG